MRLIAAILALAAPLAHAEPIPPGAYRVAVEIVLPNIESRDYGFVTTLCWRGASDPDMPLGPLGPGPLRTCPAKARSARGEVTVDTVCPGPNAGWASARYRAVPGGFRGSVAINLGGKNMTLTEIQRGRRTGPC